MLTFYELVEFRSPHLYKATRSLIDLYRALMPVHHTRTLTNVPALTILFYNDCMYIARELEKVPARLEDGIPGMDEVQYDDSIPALKALGRKWLDIQVVRCNEVVWGWLAYSFMWRKKKEETRLIQGTR